MPRMLNINFLEGGRESWFTERVFFRGDKFERDGKTWVVVAVGETVDEDRGKHSTMVVREHEDGVRPPA